MNEELKRAGWFVRIRRLINERPGITGKELARVTSNMTAPERWAILTELIAAGEITVQTKEHGPGTKGGRPLQTFWPIPAMQQAGAEQERVYDVAKMSHEQIKAANVRRTALNATLVDAGLYPMEMLPMPL